MKNRGNIAKIELKNKDKILLSIAGAFIIRGMIKMLRFQCQQYYANMI